VPMPMQLLLRSPDLADKAQALGQFVRWGTADLRLTELAICMTARHLNSDFVWSAHRGVAAENGISAQILDAIAQRREPLFDKEDEKAVYEFTRALLDTKTVSQELYDRTLAVLGERIMVELIGACGFYTLIGFTVATFDMTMPAGRKAELVK
jgi:4-carboxymuconolactone decarboxylase